MEKGKKEKKKPGKFRKILRMTAIIFLILSAIFLLLEKNLEAVILDLAHARAEAMAVEYIHQAIQDVMGQGVVYGDMMQVQTDAGPTPLQVLLGSHCEDAWSDDFTLLCSTWRDDP